SLELPKSAAFHFVSGFRKLHTCHLPFLRDCRVVPGYGSRPESRQAMDSIPSMTSAHRDPASILPAREGALLRWLSVRLRRVFSLPSLCVSATRRGIDDTFPNQPGVGPSLLPQRAFQYACGRL